MVPEPVSDHRPSRGRIPPAPAPAVTTEPELAAGAATGLCVDSTQSPWRAPSEARAPGARVPRRAGLLAEAERLRRRGRGGRPRRPGGPRRARASRRSRRPARRPSPPPRGRRPDRGRGRCLPREDAVAAAGRGPVGDVDPDDAAGVGRDPRQHARVVPEVVGVEEDPDRRRVDLGEHLVGVGERVDEAGLVALRRVNRLEADPDAGLAAAAPCAGARPPAVPCLRPPSARRAARRGTRRTRARTRRTVGRKPRASGSAPRRRRAPPSRRSRAAAPTAPPARRRRREGRARAARRRSPRRPRAA